MSWFAEDTKVTNFESATQVGTAFYVESGEYVGKVLFAGVYASPYSQSKGLYVSFELENGTVIDQYVNYQNKEGVSTREVDGKVVKGLGVDQVESWTKVLDFGRPSVEVQKKLWGKDRPIKVFENATGVKVGLLVRHILEPNQDGDKTYNKNEIEALFDIQTRKTSGELYFKEEDNRHFSIAKWLEKIAKNPTIDRTKNKKSPKVDEEEAKKVASAGW